MSCQPLPRTWKSWIPRTIAADWARVYAFEPAVWWTIAKRIVSAYSGKPRRIRSFAPQASRERMSGEPATEVVRKGTFRVLLQTKLARTRPTGPRFLISIRFEGPVQKGLP